MKRLLTFVLIIGLVLCSATANSGQKKQIFTPRSPIFGFEPTMTIHLIDHMMLEYEKYSEQQKAPSYLIETKKFITAREKIDDRILPPGVKNFNICHKFAIQYLSALIKVNEQEFKGPFSKSSELDFLHKKGFITKKTTQETTDILRKQRDNFKKSSRFLELTLRDFNELYNILNKGRNTPAEKEENRILFYNR